jgi:hypothetical protein
MHHITNFDGYMHSFTQKQQWLFARVERQKVGPAYDALKADPARAVTIDQVRATLAAEHKKVHAKV